VTSIENNGYFLKSNFSWMALLVKDHTGRIRKA